MPVYISCSQNYWDIRQNNFAWKKNRSECKGREPLSIVCKEVLKIQSYVNKFSLPISKSDAINFPGVLHHVVIISISEINDGVNIWIILVLNHSTRVSMYCWKSRPTLDA